MFRRCDFFDKMPPDNVYLTIHDAVIIALGKQRDLLEEVRIQFQTIKLSNGRKLASQQPLVFTKSYTLTSLLRKTFANTMAVGPPKELIDLIQTIFVIKRLFITFSLDNCVWCKPGCM